jgi:hypothetical protein
VAFRGSPTFEVDPDTGEPVKIAGAVRLDDAGSGVTYVGNAAAGASVAAAVWQIKKIVELNGDITITWADGNGQFDNVWNDRASLSYS